MSKSKYRIKTDYEEDDIIRYAKIKSKQQLEEFYNRNKAKLPPILQSRQIFLNHLRDNNNKRLDDLIQKTDFRSQKRSIFQREATQIIPREGKIIFDKDNTRKIKRQYLLSYTSVNRNKSQSISNQPHQIREQSSHRQSDTKVKIVCKPYKQYDQSPLKKVISLGGNKLDSNIQLGQKIQKKASERGSINKILQKIIEKQQKDRNKVKLVKRSIKTQIREQIEPWISYRNKFENEIQRFEQQMI